MLTHEIAAAFRQGCSLMVDCQICWAADAVLTPCCSKGFSPHSPPPTTHTTPPLSACQFQFYPHHPTPLSLSVSVLTLLWCLHSLRLQLHALTLALCACKKIPSVGSHAIVSTHRHTAHTRPTLKDRIWLPKWQGELKMATMQFICKTTGVQPP